MLLQAADSPTGRTLSGKEKGEESDELDLPDDATVRTARKYSILDFLFIWKANTISNL